MHVHIGRHVCRIWHELAVDILQLFMIWKVGNELDWLVKIHLFPQPEVWLVNIRLIVVEIFRGTLICIFVIISSITAKKSLLSDRFIFWWQIFLLFNLLRRAIYKHIFVGFVLYKLECSLHLTIWQVCSISLLMWIVIFHSSYRTFSILRLIGARLVSIFSLWCLLVHVEGHLEITRMSQLNCASDRSLILRLLVWFAARGQLFVLSLMTLVDLVMTKVWKSKRSSNPKTWLILLLDCKRPRMQACWIWLG